MLFGKRMTPMILASDVRTITIAIEEPFIIIIIIIIMLIIQSGRECKAVRERFTLYQPEDSSPTIQTY